MKYMEKEKQGPVDWTPSGNGQPNAQSPASHSAAKTKGLYTMLGIAMKPGRVYGISGKTGTGKTTAATQIKIQK
jgi:RecA/RadA recombinase